MLKMSKIKFLALFSLPVHAVLVFYATKGRKNAFLHDFAKNNFLASPPPLPPLGSKSHKMLKNSVFGIFLKNGALDFSIFLHAFRGPWYLSKNPYVAFPKILVWALSALKHAENE